MKYINLRIVRSLAVLPIVLLAITSTSHAANNSSLIGKKLSSWKMGKLVSGEKPTPEYLKGKVVVIDYWGIQ